MNLPLLLAVRCDNSLVEVLFLNITGESYLKVIKDWEYYMSEFDAGEGILDIDALFDYLKNLGYEFEYRIDGGDIERA